jgi:hypothetical protein
MKVWISKYRNHWISPYTILKKVCFWEKNEDIFYNLNDEPNAPYEKWVKLLDPICVALQKLLDFVHPRWTYIKIDRWDTWSMDCTLAEIILPMLIQLRNDKHGSPMVDDEDVPEELRAVKKSKRKKNDMRNNPNVHAVDWDGSDEHSTVHLKWDWVLNEMIWAFEQKVKDDDEHQFFDHTECGHKSPWDKDYVSPKVDWDGLKAHQARKTNGYRLFGKYYEGLWD